MPSPAFKQKPVDLADGREVSDEIWRGHRWRTPVGAEIGAAEQVGSGDDGRAHGPVFVSAGGPGDIRLHPEDKTHVLSMTAGETFALKK